MTIYVSSGRNDASLQTTKLFKLHNQIRDVYISGLLQIIKHSLAHLEALLFLFVKVLYEFRLLFRTSKKQVRG